MTSIPRQYTDIVSPNDTLAYMSIIQALPSSDYHSAENMTEDTSSSSVTEDSSMTHSDYSSPTSYDDLLLRPCRETWEERDCLRLMREEGIRDEVCGCTIVDAEESIMNDDKSKMVRWTNQIIVPNRNEEVPPSTNSRVHSNLNGNSSRIVLPRTEESSDGRSMKQTHELTNCESVSLCSVLTEQQDCFELGRDAGSPSRYFKCADEMKCEERNKREETFPSFSFYNERLHDHRSYTPSGGLDDMAIPNLRIPLTCHSQNENGVVVPKATYTKRNSIGKPMDMITVVTAGCRPETTLAEISFGLGRDVQKDESAAQVSTPKNRPRAVDDVDGKYVSKSTEIERKRKNDSFKFVVNSVNKSIDKHSPKIMLDTVINCKGPKPEIHENITTTNGTSFPDPKKKSTIKVSNDGATSDQRKHTRDIKIPGSSVSGQATKKVTDTIMNPTSAFTTTENETESISDSSTANRNTNNGGVKKRSTPKFLQKLRAKLYSQAVVAMNTVLKRVETRAHAVGTCQKPIPRQAQDEIYDYIRCGTCSANDNVSMDPSLVPVARLTPESVLSTSMSKNDPLDESEDVAYLEKILSFVETCCELCLPSYTVTPTSPAVNHLHDLNAIEMRTQISASIKEKVTPQESIIDEVLHNRLLIFENSSSKRAATNESVELESTTSLATADNLDDSNSLNLSMDTTEEKSSKSTHSLLPKASWMLFPEELDIGGGLSGEVSMEDTNPGPYHCIHLKGLGDGNDDEALTIECTLHNNCSDLFHVTTGEGVVNDLIALQDTGAKNSEQELNSHGSVIFIREKQLSHSTGTLAPQEHKMKVSNFRDLFCTLFGRIRASSGTNQKIEVGEQYLSDDVIALYNDSNTTHARRLLEKPSASGVDYSITNIVANESEVMKVDLAYNLRSDPNDPTTEIHECYKKHHVMNNKNRMIHTSPKTRWMRFIKK